MFTKFKDKVFEEAGFYVLKFKLYNEEWEEFVYSDKPECHQGNVYKFWCTYENNKYDCCHDLGQCNWVNSYNIDYGPIEWRHMTKEEEKKIKYRLYRFLRKRNV